jgi:thioredoxin 1
MSLPTTTDATFADDVLTAPVPVLVDFTAAWCPPCRLVEPVLEQIAAEQGDRLRVVSLDSDVNPGTVLRYDVTGMPTLALFVDGEMVVRLLGARPRVAILRALEPHLPSPAQ